MEDEVESFFVASKGADFEYACVWLQLTVIRLVMRNSIEQTLYERNNSRDIAQVSLNISSSTQHGVEVHSTLWWFFKNNFSFLLLCSFDLLCWSHGIAGLDLITGFLWSSVFMFWFYFMLVVVIVICGRLLSWSTYSRTLYISISVCFIIFIIRLHQVIIIMIMIKFTDRLSLKWPEWTLA